MVMVWLPRICLLTVLMNQICGYVLFAANLDDFRSIAKKFIPEKLADQLAEMASESSVKYHQKAEEKDAEYETNESEGDSVTKPNKEIPKAIAKKRYVIKNTVPNFNIDEIVEKVRERLMKGKKPNQKAPVSVPKAKYPNNNIENTIKAPKVEEYVDYSQNSYEDEAGKKEPIEKDYDEVTTKRQKSQIKSKIDVNEDTVTEKEVKDYPVSVKSETGPNQYGDDGKIFHEFDLRNTNDNYEDYVRPDKGRIIESEETTTTRKPTRKRTVKKTVSERTSKDYDDDKARTESLLYDERDVRMSRTIDGALRISKNKKGKGTMIPTREYYKMSSPDYYKKLPIIAEKYNFDEPIPEKDREPENLKPIGNPPARINKKVRL